MSGSQVYDQRKHMTLREPLGSLNCPVHGETNRRAAELHYGERRAALNAAHEALSRPSRVVHPAKVDDIAATPDPNADLRPYPYREPHAIAAPAGYTMTVSDLDDAYEAAAIEDENFFFDPRTLPRPNAACFDFAAIRHHRDVRRGDAKNGTVYSHDKRWAYTEDAGYRTQRIREHAFDPRTQRCSACLWSAEHVKDGMAHPACSGRPPKGERCMNCGKPHVVSIQHRGNWITQCLSCFQGVMTNGPIKDRGAVRFEQRMRERAKRDYAKGKGLQDAEDYAKKAAEDIVTKWKAIEDYAKPGRHGRIVKALSPEDRQALQALVDSAQMGNGPVYPVRPCEHRANHNDCPQCNDAGVAASIVHAREQEGRRRYAAELAAMCGRDPTPVRQRDALGLLPHQRAAVERINAAAHPEGCNCDVCVPF